MTERPVIHITWPSYRLPKPRPDDWERETDRMGECYAKLKTFYRVPRKPAFGQIWWLMRWDPTCPLDTCWEVPDFFTFCKWRAGFDRAIV